MYKFLKYISIFLLLIVLSGCNFVKKTKTFATKGKIDISQFDFSKQVFLLDGQWEFYPNQFLTPQDFKLTYDPLKIQYVDVPSSIPTYSDGTKYSDTGFATYRLLIKLPETGLYVIDYDYIYSAAKIWVNDDLVFELGEVGLNKNETKSVYGFGYFPIIIKNLDSNGFAELIIQVSDYKSSKKFGITKSLTFGKHKVMMKKALTSQMFYFAIIGLMLIMAFYYIMVFVFYPKNYAVLLFAILTIVITIRSFFTNTIIFGPANYNISIRISYISAVLFGIFALLFYNQFFKNLFNKLYVKILIFLNVSLALFYLFTPIYYFDFATIFLYLFIVTTNIFILIVLIKGKIKKIKGTTLVLVAQSIFILSMINDLLFHARVIDWGYISHYTVSIFVVLEAIVIAKNFANTYKENLTLNIQLDGQNKNLEEIVDRRTKELTDKNLQLKKLSTIAENSHNSIAVFDTDFNIKWVNKSFEKVYGEKFENINSKNDIYHLFSKKSLELTLISLQKGRSVSYENQIVNSNNEKKWLQTTLSPILVDDELVEIIAIESDISEIKIAQEELIVQNNTITSSLRYATTIQNTILPSLKDLKKYFEVFVIYSPRDIVSGDFYFYKEITHSTLSYILTGIADCTGHGVPGAFMSLIINGLLEEITLHRDISEPNEILRVLNFEIKKSLKQEQAQNTDGAAIVLLKIVPMVGYYAVTYSTANLTFIYYNSKTEEHSMLRGNVNYIGGILINKVVAFVNKSFKAYPNDIIYLQSDGITDQPNDKRKRFGKSRYYNIIKNSSNLPMNEQKTVILGQFTNWKGDIRQYDDILVFAMKFKPILQK